MRKDAWDRAPEPADEDPAKAAPHDRRTGASPMRAAGADVNGTQQQLGPRNEAKCQRNHEPLLHARGKYPNETRG